MSLSPAVTWYRGADGRQLAAHVWEPAGAARARAVFVHGISSHAGWYERGSEFLAERGIETHFLDRRGSGVDDTTRGDVDHWQTWIGDVAVYLERLRHERGATIALCGISWGGKLAAAVARRHPALVDALGLICPGLYSPFEPGFVQRLLLRTVVKGRLSQRRIVIPLSDPALFTECRERQAFIAGDPRTLREITLRFAREDRKLTRYARSAARHLTMPTLLMLAGHDRIIDNRRVRAYFDRLPIARKTLIEYPEAAHTLEFEPEPVPYWEDLSGWIVDAGEVRGD